MKKRREKKAKESLSRREGSERRKRRGRKVDRRLLCSALLRAAGRKQVSPLSLCSEKEKKYRTPTNLHTQIFLTHSVSPPLGHDYLCSG